MNAADKRIHALFIIGSDTITPNILGEVLNNINRIYGGCTLTKGKGCWSEDGDKDLPEYNHLKTETAYQIEVCATPNAFDLDKLKACFKPASPYTTWIHLEIWETEAQHFNVKEL